MREKYDFIWDEKEGTVSYLQNKSYMFREDMSNGLKESDPITTINVLMVVSIVRAVLWACGRGFSWANVSVLIVCMCVCVC